MDVRRWNEEPVEPMLPGVGRQALHTARMTVGRITLEAGAVVPRHTHEHEQVSNVLTGRLRFVVGGEEVVVAGGESLSIPPDVPHEAEALEDTLVFEVFAPPREDWQHGDDSYLRR